MMAGKVGGARRGNGKASPKQAEVIFYEGKIHSICPAHRETATLVHEEQDKDGIGCHSYPLKKVIAFTLFWQKTLNRNIGHVYLPGY